MLKLAFRTKPWMSLMALAAVIAVTDAPPPAAATPVNVPLRACNQRCHLGESQCFAMCRYIFGKTKAAALKRPPQAGSVTTRVIPITGHRH